MVNVYRLQEDLVKQHPQAFKAVFFENMPMLSPQQGWNHSRIQSDRLGGSGPSVGTSQVPVAIIDRGVEFANLMGPIPEYSSWNVKTGTADGTPIAGDSHGTCCAGIVAHSAAVSFGVAPDPAVHPIMAVVTPNFTDAQVAAAITYAANNNGLAISMSASDAYGVWNPAIINPALDVVTSRNGTICVSVGNENKDSINYPANYGSVIGVGAADRVMDDRVSPSLGYSWGSNHGPEISVCAPGINIATTDLNGTAGANPAPGAGGAWTPEFEGTSAATPHVAVLAAMIMSKCRTLGIAYTWDKVKLRIERTCEKVGSSAYVPAPPSKLGRNNRMGYGRINAMLALTFTNQAEFDNP